MCACALKRNLQQHTDKRWNFSIAESLNPKAKFPITNPKGKILSL